MSFHFSHILYCLKNLQNKYKQRVGCHKRFHRDCTKLDVLPTCVCSVLTPLAWLMSSLVGLYRYERRSEESRHHMYIPSYQYCRYMQIVNMQKQIQIDTDVISICVGFKIKDFVRTIQHYLQQLYAYVGIFSTHCHCLHI